jgi:MFS family permease
MQFAFGYLSDVGFTRHVLFAGFASIAVINLVFVEATRFWQVLVFYVLLRGAAGVYHPVSFSSIFRTAQNKSASMGFQSAFGDASLAFAMATTGFIAEGLGWRVPFILWGISGVVAIFVFARLIGVQEGRVSETDPQVVMDTNVVSNSRMSTGSFLILQSSTGFLQCVYLIFSGFMPLFLNVRMGLSAGVSALVVALWLAIGVLFTFNAGRFVDFFGGEKKTLKLCYGLTTVILAAATLFTLVANLIFATLALVILSGIPFFLAFPILYGMVGATVPGKRLGLGYATNLSLSLVAGSVLSYAAGYLSSIYSLNVILPILVAAAFAATLTAFFF